MPAVKSDSGLADWNLDYPLDSGLDFEMEF